MALQMKFRMTKPQKWCISLSLSMKEIAAEASTSYESVHTISNDCLGCAARRVSEDLTFLQKPNRMKVAEDMLEWAIPKPDS